MTLEILNQTVVSLSSTIATSEGIAGGVSFNLDTNVVESALKCSETLSQVWPTWCRYKIEYDVYSKSNGLVSGKDALIKCLSDISECILGTISDREMNYDWMVDEEKRRVVTERRMEFIDSLSGEVRFVEWADWMADDPFVNVDQFCDVDVVPEFYGETSAVSGVSGDCGSTDNVEDAHVEELTEERKDEIRSRWIELGTLSDSDVSVSRPTYVDFSDSYSNDYEIANRDDVVISIIQNTAVDEVLKDRDHSQVWQAISAIIKTLSTYSEGTDSERGKRHSDALKQVIVRALPSIISELVPSCGSVRDYSFSGSSDPVFVRICSAFKDLISFSYVSPKRFNFTTTITIGGADITTIESFSMFDL